MTFCYHQALKGYTKSWVENIYQFYKYCRNMITRIFETILQSVESRGHGFKTTRWHHNRFNLSNFRGRLKKYKKLDTWWLKLRWVLVVPTQPWGSWPLSVKRDHKIKSFIPKELRYPENTYKTSTLFADGF